MEHLDFRIEDAEPQDVEALRTIVKDSWMRVYPNEEQNITVDDISSIDWYNEEGLEKRRKEIALHADGVHTWVLKNSEDTVMGFCKVTKTDDKREIEAIYVVKELEGKGMGKKLLQKALDWLGTERDIQLKVVAYNSHAIGFYKKFGFQETESSVSYEGTKLAHGKEIPRIEMVKPGNHS